MGTADMDFRAPNCVLAEADRLREHGVIGYGTDLDAYRAAVSWWMHARHGWSVSPDGIVLLPGTLAGLALAIDVFTSPGDGVVIFEPVYGYFRKTIEACGRKAVALQLEERDGRWCLPRNLAGQRIGSAAKLLAFCSPHNPVGRVWSEAELREVLAFARMNDLVVVSDEIHCDLVYPGHTHLPLARVASKDDRVIVLAGATKTFNVPGLAVSNAMFSDPALQAMIQNRATAMCMEVSTLSVAMARAAYSMEGAAWVDACLGYLKENKRRLSEGIAGIPNLSWSLPEATYLAWISARATGENGAELCARAGIHALAGEDFGSAFPKFFRLNFGTQRKNIELVLDRLRSSPATRA